jgi:hypothetical protein
MTLSQLDINTLNASDLSIQEKARLIGIENGSVMEYCRKRPYEFVHSLKGTAQKHT